MNVFDISQEVFSCRVYQGDPFPKGEKIKDLQRGDLYNLSSFSMCAHNGTHVDAPAHFLGDGKTVDQLSLESFVGTCFVTFHSGDVTREVADSILKQAQAAGAGERILIGGKCTVTEDGARVFAASQVRLLGNESQSVGPEDSPMAVHRILMERDIILLEGIVLDHVPQGVYLLCAAPLNLNGFEGSPCRACLIQR